MLTTTATEAAINEVRKVLGLKDVNLTFIEVTYFIQYNKNLVRQ